MSGEKDDLTCFLDVTRAYEAQGISYVGVCVMRLPTAERVALTVVEARAFTCAHPSQILDAVVDARRRHLCRTFVYDGPRELLSDLYRVLDNRSVICRVVPQMRGLSGGD